MVRQGRSVSFKIIEIDSNRKPVCDFLLVFRCNYVPIFYRFRELTIYLPPTTDCWRLFVCLSVCLCARLLKNAWIDLDEMLRVDKCRDMEELINFWAQSGSYSGCQNRIIFSDIVCTATRGILLRWGKSHVQVLSMVIRCQWHAATRGFEASKDRCRR